MIHCRIGYREIKVSPNGNIITVGELYDIVSKLSAICLNDYFCIYRCTILMRFMTITVEDISPSDFIYFMKKADVLPSKERNMIMHTIDTRRMNRLKSRSGELKAFRNMYTRLRYKIECPVIPSVVPEKTEMGTEPLPKYW